MSLIKSHNHQLDSIIESNTLKHEIKISQGRIIIGEAVVTCEPKYPTLTNVELLSGFGADLITLKKYDYSKYGIKEYEKYRGLNSIIGLNFEIRSDGIVEGDTFCIERVMEMLTSGIPVGYINLTIYASNTEGLFAIKQQLSELRKMYKGLIILNCYMNNEYDLEEELYEQMEWLATYVDGFGIPIPGTVNLINEYKAIRMIDFIHENNMLAVGTICTSQESGDGSLAQELAISAKKLSYDIHLIGDAGAGKVPEEEFLYKYSLAIKGKRHTYSRMMKREI